MDCSIGIYKNSTGYNFLYLLPFGISEEYDLLYDILVEIVVSFLLSSLTLIIIITPLVLMYCWIYYSFRYVKNFKKNKSFKQILIEKDHSELNTLPKSRWPEYRRIYSKMIGFALAIITYAISSNLFMFRSYTKIKVGLKEYFSFPIDVFNGLQTVREAPNNTLPLKEVWFGMLLIVCVSIFVFFMVYFIVKKILSIKYKKELIIKYSHYEKGDSRIDFIKL
jgi:amino acid transporter